MASTRKTRPRLPHAATPRPLGDAVLEVARLAATGLTNRQIAWKTNRSRYTVNNQIASFYAFASDTLPDEPLWEECGNETQLRQSLPEMLRLVLDRFPELDDQRGADETTRHAPQPLAHVEISGVRLSFDGLASAPVVGSVFMGLLIGERVGDLLRVLERAFLGRDVGREVANQLHAVTDPGEVRRIVDTYLDVIDHLRNKHEPWTAHARNQAYWQLGCLRLNDDLQRTVVKELKVATELENCGVARVAACIALGALGFTDYVIKAAEENGRFRPWAEERHAYSLAYSGEQRAAPGQYIDRGTTYGLKRFEQGCRHLDGTYQSFVRSSDSDSPHYLRPLVMQELTFHIQARPDIFDRYPEIRARLIASVEKIEVTDEEERLLRNLMGLVPKQE